MKDDYAEFMAQAYAIELEATERYAELAEQMETHNNHDVAQVFRKLSTLEAIHAKHILDEMGWPAIQAPPPPYAGDDKEGPETAPFESVHYLMQPWHALEIALRCELRAVEYFDGVAKSHAGAKVKAAAKEMALEERGHVVLIRQWMEKVPRPGTAWDEDPDPPRMNE